MKVLLLAAPLLIATATKPAIEPMFYEERMIGVVVREGITQFQENGKTVYYISAKTLKELPR